MRVINIHQRELHASVAATGELIDRLASEHDVLWPWEQWPPMRFDRPLGVGASGGHGPIRYVIDTYEPGLHIQFRFTEPEGFLGTHRFEIEEVAVERVTLRHAIEMQATGGACWSWLFVIRPLHNALVEDALDRAEVFVGGTPKRREWSLWVKFLRWNAARRRSVRKK